MEEQKKTWSRYRGYSAWGMKHLSQLADGDVLRQWNQILWKVWVSPSPAGNQTSSFSMFPSKNMEQSMQLAFAPKAPCTSCDWWDRLRPDHDGTLGLEAPAGSLFAMEIIPFFFHLER